MSERKDKKSKCNLLSYFWNQKGDFTGLCTIILPLFSRSLTVMFKVWLSGNCFSFLLRTKKVFEKILIELREVWRFIFLFEVFSWSLNSLMAVLLKIVRRNNRSFFEGINVNVQDGSALGTGGSGPFRDKWIHQSEDDVTWSYVHCHWSFVTWSNGLVPHGPGKEINPEAMIVGWQFLFPR